MHRLLAIPMGKKVGLVVVNKAVMSQDKKVFAIVTSGVYFRTTQRGNNAAGGGTAVNQNRHWNS